MKRRALNPRVLVVSSLLVIALVGGAAAVILFSPGTARTALLTVLVGSASIQRQGAGATTGHSGDGLGNGDAVSTSKDGKASITYPDGSVTRLDSSTKVLVHFTQTGSSIRTSLVQSAGLTWNTVKRLAGGSSFNITGPNSATAEVRGTRFGYYVEHDTANNPVVWIDVYDGVVGVTGSTGPSVLASAGQRVTVRPATAPTQPVPIPAGDLRLSFTVFNQTIEAVTGTPIAFRSGILAAGQPGISLSVQADGKSDLQFVLGWPTVPGSLFAMSVFAPAGSVFFSSQSTAPALIIVAPKAAAGTWTVSVQDLRSAQPDEFWLVVGRS